YRQEDEWCHGNEVDHARNTFNTRETGNHRISFPEKPLQSKQVVQTEQKTGCNYRRQYWNKYIPQHFNEPLQRVHLSCSSFFHFIFGAAPFTGLFFKDFKCFIHRTLSDNNLELIVSSKRPFNQIDRIQLFLIHLALIIERQT